MLITYRRVGSGAVLPAVAAAGVFVIVGGIAATIAVTALSVVAVVAVGTRVLRAFGVGAATRRLAFDADQTIEGVVVNRSSVGSEPGVTPRREPASSRAAGPR